MNHEEQVAVNTLLAKAHKAEREVIIAWLDQTWTGDTVEEREHRKYIVDKLRQKKF